MDEKKVGKEPYVEPKVLASYKKEELEEIIRPHGPIASPIEQPGSG